MHRKPKILISALALSLSLAIASCSSSGNNGNGYNYPTTSSRTINNSSVQPKPTTNNSDKQLNNTNPSFAESNHNLDTTPPKDQSLNNSTPNSTAQPLETQLPNNPTPDPNSSAQDLNHPSATTPIASDPNQSSAKQQSLGTDSAVTPSAPVEQDSSQSAASSQPSSQNSAPQDSTSAEQSSPPATEPAETKNSNPSASDQSQTQTSVPAQDQGQSQESTKTQPTDSASPEPAVPSSKTAETNSKVPESSTSADTSLTADHNSNSPESLAPKTNEKNPEADKSEEAPAITDVKSAPAEQPSSEPQSSVPVTSSPNAEAKTDNPKVVAPSPQAQDPAHAQEQSQAQEPTQSPEPVQTSIPDQESASESKSQVADPVTPSAKEQAPSTSVEDSQSQSLPATSPDQQTTAPQVAVPATEPGKSEDQTAQVPPPASPTDSVTAEPAVPSADNQDSKSTVTETQPAEQTTDSNTAPEHQVTTDTKVAEDPTATAEAKDPVSPASPVPAPEQPQVVKQPQVAEQPEATAQQTPSAESPAQGKPAETSVQTQAPTTDVSSPDSEKTASVKTPEDHVVSNEESKTSPEATAEPKSPSEASAEPKATADTKTTEESKTIAEPKSSPEASEESKSSSDSKVAAEPKTPDESKASTDPENSEKTAESSDKQADPKASSPASSEQTASTPSAPSSEADSSVAKASDPDSSSDVAQSQSEPEPQSQAEPQVEQPSVSKIKPFSTNYEANPSDDDHTVTNASEIYTNPTSLTTSLAPYQAQIDADSNYDLHANFNLLDHNPTDNSQFSKDLDDLILFGTKYSYIQSAIDISPSHIAYLHNNNTSISDQSYNSEANTPFNQYNLIAQGLLPLFMGKHTYTSVKLANSSSLFVKPNLNPGEGHFTADQIHVGIVDSGISSSDNTTDNFVHPVIKVSSNAGSFTAVNNDNNYVDHQDQHGLMVSSIIASKRDSSHLGIAPNAQVYASTLQYDNSTALSQQQKNLDQLYQHVWEQGHPVSINNSFVLDDLLYAFIAKSPKNMIYSQQHQQELATSLSQALTKFKEHKTEDQLPLMVFASGNYRVDESQFGSYSLIDKFKINVNDPNAPRTVNRQDLVAMNHDSNYGYKIPKGTYLDLVLKDRELAKNMIIVSGGVYDPFMNHYWKNYDKIYNALNSFYGQYGILNKTLDRYYDHNFLEDKRKISSGFVHTSSYQDKKLFNSTFGAFQCGALKYDCVTAAYIYAAPSYIKANNIGYNRIVYGTSYATPVVTALAAVLKEQFPWMTASNLKTTILTTALDVGEPGVDDVFGWGFVDANKAIKGPGMFAFGDFKANLSIRPYGWNKEQHYSTYFTNNIYGNGGLIVDADSSLEQLYLTGNNKYTGKTIINGGTVIVTTPSNLGLDQTIVNNRQAGLISDVSVNSKGQFVAKDVTLNNLTNNGKVVLDNVYFTGSFVQQPHGFTAVPINTNITLDSDFSQAGHLFVFYPEQSYRPTVNYKYRLFTVTADHNISGKFAQAVLVDNKAQSHQPTTTPPTSDNAIPSSPSATCNSIDHYPSLDQIFVQTAPTTEPSASSSSTASTTTVTTSTTTEPKTARATNGSTIVVLTPTVEDHSVIVQIPAYNPQPDLQAARVQAASGDSLILDQGYQATLGVFNQANVALQQAQLTATNSSVNNRSSDAKNLVSLASFVQNLTPAQYRTFLYANSGISFTDLQLATTSNYTQKVTDFSQQVGAKFMTDVQYQQANLDLVQHTNALTYQAYASFSHNNQQWSVINSAVHGKYIDQSATMGIYSQYLRHSLGFGYVWGNGKWHEDVNVVKGNLAPTLNNDLTNQLNLANAQVYSQGLILSYGYALPRFYFNTSASVIYHSYKLNRTSLYSLDQNSQFTSWQALMHAELGIRLWRTSHQGLDLALGTSYNHYYQPALTEQANYPTAQVSKYLSVYSDAHSTNNAQASVGLTYSNQFKLFGINQMIKLNTSYSHSYVQANYSFSNQLVATLYNHASDSSVNNGLTIANNVTNNPTQTKFTTAQAFKLNWKLQFKASYQVQFTPSLTLGTDISYQLTKNWHNQAGTLNIIYSF